MLPEHSFLSSCARPNRPKKEQRTYEQLQPLSKRKTWKVSMKWASFEYHRRLWAFLFHDCILLENRNSNSHKIYRSEKEKQKEKAHLRNWYSIEVTQHTILSRYRIEFIWKKLERIDSQYLHLTGTNSNMCKITSVSFNFQISWLQHCRQYRRGEKEQMRRLKIMITYRSRW